MRDSAWAVARVKQYGVDMGIEGFLETLTDMEANEEWLSEEELAAYRITMRVGRALFAPS